MAAAPYMPLYIADYLADAAHLSTLEHGAYLLLIMTYWQTGKPLPNDDHDLAQICRLSCKKFQKVKPKVEKFFSVNVKEWRHKRIDKELQKFKEKSDKKRFAGKKGAKKRWGEDDGICHSNAIATPMPIDSYTDTDTDIDTDTDTDKKIIVKQAVNLAVSTTHEDYFAALQKYFKFFLPAHFAKLRPPDRQKYLHMMNNWLAEGVIVDDIYAAIEHIKNRGGGKKNPKYYDKIAVDFAKARRKDGNYESITNAASWQKFKTTDEQIREAGEQVKREHGLA